MVLIISSTISICAKGYNCPVGENILSFPCPYSDIATLWLTHQTGENIIHHLFSQSFLTIKILLASLLNTSV